MVPDKMIEFLGRIMDLLDDFSDFREDFYERYITWRLVRSLGELQILTRASYAMLIIVPLLAGTCPAVRVAVNQYNKAMTDAAAIFDQAAARLSTIEDKFSASKIDPALNDLIDTFKLRLAQYKADLSSKTIQPPTMPRTLVAAFIAALAVVLAQTLYQMFAPDVLRRMTLDQYVANKKEDYSKHPTPDAIQKARDELRPSGWDASEFFEKLNKAFEARNPFTDKDISNYVDSLSPFEQDEAREFTSPKWEKKALGRDRFPPELISTLHQLLNSIHRNRDPAKSLDIDRQTQMSIISRGAKQTYLRVAGTNRPIMVLTAVIYGVSVYMIVSILFVQTMSIISAAGIGSPVNVIDWWKDSPR